MQGEALTQFVQTWGVPAAIAVFLVWHLNSNFNSLFKQWIEAQQAQSKTLGELIAVLQQNAESNAKVAAELALLRQEVWSLKDRFDDDREKIPRH